MSDRSFFFILGPTASGKGRVAAGIARRVGGEVVVCDSMKVYRGMDIGTAKHKEGAADVPHHGVDLVDPWERFSAADWVAMAEETVAGVEARGNVPIFCGGTVFYMRGLTEGLFDGPSADPELRAELKARAAEEGRETLHDELAEVDPAAAERIHPNDLRRVVRALEVHAKTGRPITELQREWDDAPDPDRTLVALRWPDAVLRSRIETRVDRMIEQGLVEEVEALLDAPRPPGKTACQALGYAQLIPWLEQDRPRPLEEVADEIKRETWRFARQQRTWLRRFEDLERVDLDQNSDLDQVAAELASRHFPARLR